MTDVRSLIKFLALSTLELKLWLSEGKQTKLKDLFFSQRTPAISAGANNTGNISKSQGVSVWLQTKGFRLLMKQVVFPHLLLRQSSVKLLFSSVDNILSFFKVQTTQIWEVVISSNN